VMLLNVRMARCPEDSVWKACPLSHGPLHRWMRDSLPRSDPRAAYAVLARAADISDIASSASAEGAQLCLRAKAVVLKASVLTMPSW